MLDKSMVVDELRDSHGDEYDFDGEVGSINAHHEGPDSVVIGHMVVVRGERRKGVGSVLMDAMLEVLWENEVYTVTVEIQALDDGSENDGVMEFLRGFGFEYVGSFEHHNWGTCVRAVRR